MVSGRLEIMNKICLLVPTYNRWHFLKECLEDLKNQTYSEFDVVIYDDGSTDGTGKELMDWCIYSRISYRLHYIRSEENHGVGYARNKLLEYIDKMPEEKRPKYLMWQDSDDFSHPSRLALMLKAIDTQDCDIAFSHMFFFASPVHTQTRTVHKIDVSKYNTEEESINNNMNFATAIFKSELTKYSFDETVRKNEDGKWLLKLLNNGIKVGYLHKPLYYCRRHPGRLTYKGKY